MGLSLPVECKSSCVILIFLWSMECLYCALSPIYVVSMFQEKPPDYVPPDTQRDMAYTTTSECSNLPVPSNTKPPNLMRDHTGNLIGYLCTTPPRMIL